MYQDLMRRDDPDRAAAAPAPPRLKPRAQALLDAAEPAGALSVSLDRPYLVKGWLDRGAVSVLYGPSNTGKSFLAVDIADHVSKGAEWGGWRVTQGNVLYIAAEGGSSFDNRVRALDDRQFWVLKAGLTLIEPQPDAAPLIEMVQHLEAMHGRYDLIVVDTLARVMGAGDENTAPDIAALVASLDAIRGATGAHVMLVHHSGKDLARGARGHSALRAAIDTEIVLGRDDDTGVISAALDKQRDGPTGYKFHFTLRQVELGRDQDGDPVTTCHVEPGRSAEAERAAVKGPALVALGTLDKLLAERGEVIRRPHCPGGPAVPARDWQAACLEAGLSASGSRDANRKAFYRARQELLDAAAICIRDNFVWRVED